MDYLELKGFLSLTLKINEQLLVSCVEADTESGIVAGCDER